jgi:hypothetical protein
VIHFGSPFTSISSRALVAGPRLALTVMRTRPPPEHWDWPASRQPCQG